MQIFQGWRILLHKIEKIVFSNISTDLIRKFLKYWEAVKLKEANTVFIKIIIFAWKWNVFHHQQQILLTVFLCSFLRKYLPYTQIWITIVLDILQSKNGTPWKKLASSAHNWNYCSKALPWDVHVYCTLVSSRSNLWILLIPSIRIIKWHVLKSSDLIIIIILLHYQRYSQIKQISFFLFLWHYDSED